VKKVQIHNKKELLEFRRELRRNLTPAEAFLWKHLKAKQLDGEVHQNSTAMEYDERRTAYLNREGFTVIRFENKMVFDNLKSVLVEIRENFKKK